MKDDKDYFRFGVSVGVLYLSLTMVLLVVSGAVFLHYLSGETEKLVALSGERVEYGFDCDALLDGNVQFDGAPLRVRGTRDASGLPVVVSTLGLESVPVNTPVVVHTPDFKEFRVNHVKMRCSGSGSAPLIALMGFEGVFG